MKTPRFHSLLARLLILSVIILGAVAAPTQVATLAGHDGQTRESVFIPNGSRVDPST
jgi:hypothetical protein